MVGKSKIYKGKLTFGDRTYECEVKDGIRYIDGKTVDEFLATLDEGYASLLSGIGQQIISGKKKIKN